MRLNESARQYFKTLSKEDRLEGQEIFKFRKSEFAIISSSTDYWELSAPVSLNSEKPLRMAFTSNHSRLIARCTCRYFKTFQSCKHVAAGALFLEELKEKPQKAVAKDTTPAMWNPDFHYSLAMLFQTGGSTPGVTLKPVLLTERNNETSLERFSALLHVKDSLLSQFPSEYRQAITELDDGKKGFANRQSGEKMAKDYMNSSGFEEHYAKFLFNKLKMVWPALCEYPHIYGLPSPLVLKTGNTVKLSLRHEEAAPHFFVYADGEKIVIQLKFFIDNISVDYSQLSLKNNYFIVYEDRGYLLKNYDDALLLRRFHKSCLEFPLVSRLAVYDEVIQPLQQKYDVKIAASAGLTFKEVKPEPYILVAEYLNQYLMMIPHFEYEEQSVAYRDIMPLRSTNDDGDCYLLHDINFENEFFESLRPLHPNFKRQMQQPFFYVPFTDVMKGNWFLKTIRKLQAENVQVRGMQNLKRFRYSAATPRFQTGLSSGVDWFNIKINTTFDGLAVPLMDIRNAVVSGQKMVVLGDGSFGMLPEDWLKQFDAIIRMGEVKGDTLRLNKKYFMLLLEMDLPAKEENMLKELQAKKEALVDLQDAAFAPVSPDIHASLRPYQQSGFHWLQSLDHYGWGGCLADDMGLGKTLQTITFLQFIKEKYTNCSLVVCPTSLIYNWESEIQKFAPSLRYFIYYGPNREWPGNLKKYDVIITSYGTVRNDIGQLKKYGFQYIILDESQMIKNAEARTTKACMLLTSKNRLILSGTPVQNNTFDLFAQMHFLNPGFLGNKNSFKNQYAIPIDKNNDRAVVQKLKEMTKPFILRRTKENVASDLPDKSEIILWCQMKEAQREVYDRFKDYYRYELLNRINSEGINKSSIYILEGLTRLRQICNSPALINDTSVTTRESTKMKELLREIKENTGNHKVLIFSQFTSMLKLISENLEKSQTLYFYLDGQTPGKTRMELVKDFQENDSVKVFLISLKAGGVGLNLTAADYVYLVDPWWNPAAESQAIDRTHRIGQTNKVFAYKMICKDSIEEKILELQHRKKTLSKDLISEDISFISKLSKEDVEYLFG